MIKKPIFSSFTEYWHYARYLSRKQRKIIYANLSDDQKEFLDNSYLKDGWCDLFYRNEVNEKLDELKDTYGYDILEIRARVIRGKSAYVPSKFWQIVEEQMYKYKPDTIKFVMSGIKVKPCDKNKQVSLVTYSPDDIDD